MSSNERAASTWYSAKGWLTGSALRRAALQAIRLHPGFVGAYAALGKHLQSIHHTHEAIATFEKALALSPQDASLNAGIMQVRRAVGWLLKSLSSALPAFADAGVPSPAATRAPYNQLAS